MKFRQRINIDRSKLEAVVATDPRMDSYANRISNEIITVAKATFESRQRKDNEWRLSETTPPKYLASFYKRKIGGVRWHVGNSDPAAVWVEYGAHAGGETRVLGYRPLTTGLTTVAGAA